MFVKVLILFYDVILGIYVNVYVVFQSENEVCSGCGSLIAERYLLKVSERCWHPACLRCTVCQTTLDHHASCYVREGRVYCKVDYSK